MNLLSLVIMGLRKLKTELGNLSYGFVSSYHSCVLGTDSIQVAIKSGEVGRIVLSCAVMAHDKPLMMIHVCCRTWRTLYNVLNNDRLESLSPQNTK